MITATLLLGLIVVATVAMWVVFNRFTPGPPSAEEMQAQQVTLEQLAEVEPPVEVATRVEGSGWIAWAPARPSCQLVAPTDQEARAQLGQLIRAGDRPECQPQPTPTTNQVEAVLGSPTDDSPRAGWHLDPLWEQGEPVLRYWDGDSWTLDTAAVPAG